MNKILRDFHMHTVYCDGRDSAEAMVEAAIALGMDMVGISGHAYTPCDLSFCMTPETTADYIAEIRRLKEKYAGKIEILLGTERDYYSEGDFSVYDYVIGSVHYVLKDGAYLAVDESPELLKSFADRYYGGDIYALAEAYYKTEGDVIAKTGADIVGHFNLIEKFNEGGAMLDAENPRYVAAWQAAADRLLESGRIFEINTGAISRGYRTAPYPGFEMMDYIAARGGRFILSSDSHRTDTLMYEFEKWGGYAVSHGLSLTDSPVSIKYF